MSPTKKWCVWDTELPGTYGKRKPGKAGLSDGPSGQVDGNLQLLVVPAPDDDLSPQERALLTLLANGCTRSGAARRLQNSPATVAWYLQQIFRKLGVHGQAEAVAKAIRLGLIR
jgi:DNA-binding CsgD family transcriptional regulator